MKAFRALLLPAGLALAAPGLARDLVDVPVVDHFPLQVDRATIKREGKVVSFSYLMAVPKAFEGRKVPEGQWSSNEIETVIDCREETYTLGKVTVYSGPKGEGAVENVLPAASDKKPLTIYPRSTAGYLAEFICR